MKERLKGILAGVLIGLLVGSGAVQAASGIITKELYYDNIKITLNGKELRPVDANGKYVEPFIIDGTTYLPVRAISGALGLQVDWDGQTSTVILSDGAETQPPAEPGKQEAYFKCNMKKQIPDATGKRRFTDDELTEMRDMSLQNVAAKITTLADAYAWLAVTGHVQGGMAMSTGADILHNTVNPKLPATEKNPNWLQMSMMLHYLLDGDYEDVGTLLCVGYPGQEGWTFWYISFNYVKTDGVYYITYSPDFLPCNGLPLYKGCTVETNDLALFRDALELVNGDVSDMITLADMDLTMWNVRFEKTDDPLSVTFPEEKGVRYLYQINEEDLKKYEEQKAAEAAAEWEQWKRHASSVKISDYHLPAAIGNTTLTYVQAAELVGKEPEIIADKVKTVGDVLQYMIAARFGYNSPNAFTPWYGGWGFDAPGDDQLRQNYGCCCGGYANTVSYLLRGDYEKAGTLRWVGNNNHTISWVYTNGKYYVFDATQFSNGGNFNNMHPTVTQLDDLGDYYDVFPKDYERNGKKEDLAIMVAFEVDGGAMYPSVWRDPPKFTGLTFPTEAKGKITVIHQKDAEHGVLFQDVPADTIPRYEGK